MEIRIPLLFLAVTAAVLVAGCGTVSQAIKETQGVINETAEAQLTACSQSGHRQAACLAENALTATNLSRCDDIDVSSLQKAENSSENPQKIAAVKDKCYYDVAIKTKLTKGCGKIKNSKYIYNGDVCYFKIAQDRNDIQLCFEVSPAGRVNPEGGPAYNEMNCRESLKAKLIATGCGKGAQLDMTCVVSLGVAKNNPDVCDEFFTASEDINQKCKADVKNLMQLIETFKMQTLFGTKP